MPVYITHDGERYTAIDAHDLVRQMRKASSMPTASLRGFMEEMAERTKMQDARADIPTHTVEAFVAALIKEGFIGIEE